jgi:hypothetical protein
MLRICLWTIAMGLGVFWQSVAHADAVAYFLDDSVVPTMNHFTPSGNTALAGGWTNNGFVGAGDGTAYFLEGTTMYHVTPSGLTALPGGWNNGGFVGAGDGTAYLMDDNGIGPAIPYHFTPSGGTKILFYSNSNVAGFVGAGDGTAYVLEQPVSGAQVMTHLTPTGAAAPGGGWNNQGFVGAGDGTAYILDGTLAHHITPTGTALIPFYGNANNAGFVGAGDGTAFILEQPAVGAQVMTHLTPTGASPVPGGWNNNGFVGAGDGTAYILDNTSVFHITPSGLGPPIPFFGIGAGNQNGFVGAGDGTAFILDGTTMYHLTPTSATSLPGGWNNLGFVGAGFVDTSTDDADFDNSNLVDGNDFLIWQRGFGSTGQIDNSMGDANLDGNVLGDDLTIWETQYGGPPPVVGALVSVPEPNSLALALMLLAVLFVQRTCF